MTRQSAHKAKGTRTLAYLPCIVACFANAQQFFSLFSDRTPPQECGRGGSLFMVLFGSCHARWCELPCFVACFSNTGTTYHTHHRTRITQHTTHNTQHTTHTTQHTTHNTQPYNTQTHTCLLQQSEINHTRTHTHTSTHTLTRANRHADTQTHKHTHTHTHTRTLTREDSLFIVSCLIAHNPASAIQ